MCMTSIAVLTMPFRMKAYSFQSVYVLQIPEFDNFYLDMNGIIHVCSHPNDDDPTFRISEDKIFSDIFNYLEVRECWYMINGMLQYTGECSPCGANFLLWCKFSIVVL